MGIRLQVLVAVLCFVAGYFVAEQLQVPEVKTETKEVEVVRNQIKTIIRTVEKPDGSKETTTETTDNSVIKQSRSEKVQIVLPKKWIAGVGVQSDYRLVPSYSVQINRRIIGPFFAGVTANTRGEFGLQILAEF